eukprot:CAMPEP_0194395144 /NCGR_PEP_ID=MMETSP0174-20130528/124256_1 /TAXON_ID=216777 /ORGANISM="Proboscia alata, Strain PI-D3" /LENGTH=383 /DNA_ID=CAMNT_0039191039 /DNA_START=74 /DNA_END=1225 /DNA_ORIENTATION=+
MSEGMSTSTLYPFEYPDGTKRLTKIPGPYTKLDSLLVASSSLFLVGSVVWVPFLFLRAIRRYWRLRADDNDSPEELEWKKKRRRIVGSLILMATVVIGMGPHRTERLGEWTKIRKWRFWKSWLRFVSLEVIQACGGGRSTTPNAGDTALTFDVTKDPAILAIIPHGLFPFALAFPALGTEDTVRAFGRFRTVVATATKYFPFINTVLAWLGAVDASRSAVSKTLSLGDRIGLAPGGIAEMFEGYPKPNTHPDDEYTILANRKGFIRMAIQHNVPVVPIYAFGATKLFKRFQLPEVFETVSKMLRISICVFFGRFGLPIPFRQRLLYVMGCPVFPPDIGDVAVGSEEYRRLVDDMHAKFSERLLDLFDRHKASYGWGHKTLKII